MSNTKTFSGRIASSFGTFRDSNLFTDLILRSGDRKYQVHRIFMAQSGGWFARALADLPVTEGKCPRIDLPEDPKNTFETFLELLYTGKAEVTIRNIVELLKLGVFYECEFVTRAMRYLIQTIATEENCLELSKRFAEMGMIEDGVRLAPIVGCVFKKILENGRFARIGKSTFTLTTIFESLAPRVFAAAFAEVLKEIDMNDQQRVEMIDRYAEGKEITDERDKAELGKLINWEAGLAYKYLVQYRCDWVPAGPYRRLAAQVLANRQQTLKRLTARAKSAPERVSPWFLAGWLTAISNATKIRVKCEPVYRILDFITTLGGAVKPVDPLVFGFVEYRGSVEPMCRDCGVHQFFTADGYWMAKQRLDLRPCLGLRLPRGEFSVSKYYVSQQIPSQKWYLVEHAPKRPRDHVFVKLGNNLDWNGDVVRQEVVPEGEGEFSSAPGKYSVVGVEFGLSTDPNVAKFEVEMPCRLASFDVEGSFAPTLPQ